MTESQLENNRAYQRERYKNNPEHTLARVRRNRFLRLYGITVEDYDTMLRKQEGKCAICRGYETRELHGKVVSLSVDHNHITGKVRELLCSSCNQGKFKESPDLLRAAASYFEKHGGAKD